MFRTILFYSIIFICTSGFGQDHKFSFKHFTTREGLSHQNIVDVFQDSRDFLWIATSDGLNRYDGRNFTHFFHDEDAKISSISSNNIFKVIEDKYGKIFVSNSEGIDRYDPVQNKWKKIFALTDDKDRNTGALFFLLDMQNHLWVATLNKVYKLDSNYHVVRTYSTELYGNGIIFKIQNDAEGNIWVNRSGTLNKINLKTGTVFNKKNNPEEYAVFNIPMATLIFDKHQEIWGLSQRHSLIHINNFGKDLQEISLDTTLLFLNISKSQHNQIWISTLGQGLLNYDIASGATTKFLNDPNNANTLCRNVVNGIFEDKNNNTWVYTDNGLDFIPNHRISFWEMDSFSVNEKANTNETFISDLTFYNDDVWIAGWGKGLLKYNSKNKLHEWYSSGPTAIDKFVWNVLTFNKQIWYGTYNGLFAFDPVKKTRSNFWSNSSYTVKHDSIAAFGLFKDHRHNVWASLLGGEGILKYDSATQQYQHYSLRSKGKYYFPFNHYDAITEDHKGSIWMGSNRMKGLVCFDDKTQSFQLLMKDNKTVFQDQINGLAAQNDVLWIGSNSGLYCMNLLNYKIKKYTRKEGLLNNNINALFIDKNGELWIGTSNGLSKLNSNNQFIHFTADDDIPEGQINRIIENPYNKSLYITTPHTFFVINPDSITNDFYQLKPNLLRFAVNGIMQSPDLQNKYYTIVSDKYFSFAFSAPFFPSAEKVQYAYMLEGYDQEWRYVGNVDNVIYDRLPSGSFRFRVKASIDGVHWNESNSPIQLILHQPFYQTAWFKMLCALILLLITGIVFFIRYRIKLNQVLYGQSIRVKIAEDIHDDISSGLTKITWLSQILKSRIQQKEIGQATETANQIAEATQDTMNKIGEIIWSSNPQHDNLTSFLSYLRNYISVYFENTDTRVTLIFPQEEDNIPLSPELIRQLFLIIKESLNNVMKYASADNVTVDFNIKAANYYLSISDDGIGFCPSDKKGTGNGHLNMKKRASSIYAEISIDSLPGKGTTISVNGKFYV